MGSPPPPTTAWNFEAAISALTVLKKPCQVEFHTDSNYLKNGSITKWLPGYKQNGWRSKAEAAGEKIATFGVREEPPLLLHKITWALGQGPRRG